jgi:hypothetical protein
MPADARDPSPSSLTLHEVLIEARRRLGDDAPSYQWAYARVLSGELPAEKIGQSWQLPPLAVDVLLRLWRARRRRPSCAA